jgi:phage tail-like protein
MALPKPKPPFSVNTTRFDPYKNSRFLVFFDPTTDPVAGVSKVGGLKRTTQMIPYNEGGKALTLKGLGRTSYDPITLERGVTHDSAFVDWADCAQKLDQGHPTQNLVNLRRDIHLVLLNEQGQQVHRYNVHDAWVSEYQAMSDLDAGANAVVIEHIKVEHQGWEHDDTLTEPDQAAPPA